MQNRDDNDIMITTKTMILHHVGGDATLDVFSTTIPSIAVVLYCV